MPAKAIGELVNINDEIIWRMIDYYVDEAYEAVDMSAVKTQGLMKPQVNAVTIIYRLLLTYKHQKLFFQQKEKTQNQLKH